MVLSRRLAGDPRWRGLAGYALATGIALLVLFVAFGVLVGPDEAPLHPYAGLTQRLVLAVWFLAPSSSPAAVADCRHPATLPSWWPPATRTSPDTAAGPVAPRPGRAVPHRRVPRPRNAAGGCGADRWQRPVGCQIAGDLLDAGRRVVLATSRGVWYVGMRWLIRRSSGILHGFPGDSATVADAVRTHLDTVGARLGS